MRFRQFQDCLRPNSPVVVRRIVLVCTVCLISAMGCQKSQTNDSAVVPPPDRSETSDSTPSKEPPGEIELPAGADLNQASPPVPKSPLAPGGLEMPTGIEPVETGSTGTAIDVRYATWQEIEQAATSTGKITVVDLWSLVCEPCLKEFPGLVRLHQEMGDRVHCIAVDVDFDGRKTRPPETYQEPVSAFLDSVGAKFPTYISRTPSDEIFAANRLASIPAVLVYGADGKLVQVFEDAGETAGFSYEKDIVPLVKKLAG